MFPSPPFRMFGQHQDAYVGPQRVQAFPPQAVFPDHHAFMRPSGMQPPPVTQQFMRFGNQHIYDPMAQSLPLRARSGSYIGQYSENAPLTTTDPRRFQDQVPTFNRGRGGRGRGRGRGFSSATMQPVVDPNSFERININQARKFNDTSINRGHPHQPHERNMNWRSRETSFQAPPMMNRRFFSDSAAQGMMPDPFRNPSLPITGMVPGQVFNAPYNGQFIRPDGNPVSYTHLTLPTKRIV